MMQNPHTRRYVVIRSSKSRLKTAATPAGLTAEPERVTRSGSKRGVDLSVLKKTSRADKLRGDMQSLSLDDVPYDDVLELRERGGYALLERLDAATLTAHEDMPQEAIQEAVGDAYVVVPDVPLSIGLPDQTQQRSTTRLTREMKAWPAQSGVAAAHAAGHYGKDVIVGVLDTGIDADHGEFRGREVPFLYVPLSLRERDMRDEVRGFDPGGHGTHVCGIVAGQQIGVAPEATLAVASVIESETTTTSLSRIIRGIDWFLELLERPEYSDKPALLNLSLGFVPDQLTSAGRSALMVVGDLLETLAATDILPIVAIGNEGPNNARTPGISPHVLAVGAVDQALEPAPFSGSAPLLGKPDVCGYGVGVWSSYERDRAGRPVYRPLDGTSMATPYVTGIAALMASRDPSLVGGDLRQALTDNALSINGHGARVGRGLARFV